MNINIPLKTLILLSLLALISTTASAQQIIKFYLQPSGDFLFGDERTTTEPLVSTFIRIVPFSADSAFQIRESNTFESSRTAKIDQSFGGGLRGMMEIPVGTRLSVRTGLGLRYERYELDESAGFSLTSIASSIDTLGNIAFTSNGGGFTPIACTQVFEGFDGFEDQFNFIPEYSNLLLEVPLALRYELLPNKLGISLGATVITPLRSTYEFIEQQFNVLGQPDVPEGECANVVRLATETNGGRTNDFQVAGEATADLVLTNRLSVVATVSQMFTDRFNQEEETIFFNSGFSGSYRPLRLSLGVQWSLGGGVAIEN